jgi:hypothetical protein
MLVTFVLKIKVGIAEWILSVIYIKYFFLK